MEKELAVALLEQGGSILSDVIRMVGMKPRMSARTLGEEVSRQLSPPNPPPAPAYQLTKRQEPEPEQAKLIKAGKAQSLDEHQQSLDYRFECVLKHLGGASVLLKEAYQRANDEGIGDGTAEKIMEAMSEHSGMEADLDKMINMPDVKPLVDKLYSGERAFRAAAWKAHLPIGGGTKEDIADSRIWNDMLLAEVMTAAKRHPGQQCVIEGM